MNIRAIKNRQISVITQVSSNPFRGSGPCVVYVVPQSGSRAVQIGLDSLRVAFLAAEIRLVAAVMNRAYPKLRFKLPRMRTDQNQNYVPGEEARPFLAAGDDGLVRIGVEIANCARYPVVQLTAKPNSRVRREGMVTAWTPSWTEFRVLVAEYASLLALTSLFPQPAQSRKDTSARP